MISNTFYLNTPRFNMLQALLRTPLTLDDARRVAPSPIRTLRSLVEQGYVRHDPNASPPVWAITSVGRAAIARVLTKPTLPRYAGGPGSPNQRGRKPAKPPVEAPAPVEVRALPAPEPEATTMPQHGEVGLMVTLKVPVTLPLIAQVDVGAVAQAVRTRLGDLRDVDRFIRGWTIDALMAGASVVVAEKVNDD